MKKVLFTVMLVLGAILTQAATIQGIDPQFVTNETDNTIVAAPFAEVHLSGTMTSSCGVTWNFTYDCYSGCTFSNTLERLGDLQSAINDACGSGITRITLEY